MWLEDEKVINSSLVDIDFLNFPKKEVVLRVDKLIDNELSNIKLDFSESNLIYFRLNNRKIWAIEYWEEEEYENTIILDFIWNKNAFKKDFTRKNICLMDWYKDLLWRIDEDFYLEWLWEFMIKEFIVFSKENNYKFIKIMIWHDSLFKTINKLKEKEILKDFYTEDWITTMEL